MKRSFGYTMKSIAATLAAFSVLATTTAVFADEMTQEEIEADIARTERYREDMKDNPWVPGTEAWCKRIRELNQARQEQIQQDLHNDQDPEGEDPSPEGDEPTGDEPTGEGPTGDAPAGDGSQTTSKTTVNGDIVTTVTTVTKPDGSKVITTTVTDMKNGSSTVTTEYIAPGGRPTGDEPTGDDPTGDDPTGDDPTGDDPTGDNPTGDDPTGDEPAGDEPTGDEPTGDEPTGDEPTGDEPTGDKPTGDKPTGDDPKGDDTTDKDPKGGDKDDKDDKDDGDNWLTDLLKTGLEKAIDKGIDKGLDYVFDDLLGGGDNGWMSIVKKLPYDKIAGTLCNIVDHSLGGDGSGNNGKYSNEQIEEAFKKAVERAMSGSKGGASDSGTTTTTTIADGYKIVTVTTKNEDGTTTITELITELATGKTTTTITILDKNGKPIVPEEPKTPDSPLPKNSTVEKAEYSTSDSYTKIDIETKVDKDGKVHITKTVDELSSNGSQTTVTYTIEQRFNENGTITTTQHIKRHIKTAVTVWGDIVHHYEYSDENFSYTFTETPAEYKARLEREQKDNGKYGYRNSYEKYDIDENGARI